MIELWLKAGMIESGSGFAPTEQGTPQGGVISPLLLNVALHGLEEAVGAAPPPRRPAAPTGLNPGSTPNLSVGLGWRPVSSVM
jgi:RNA-directed DNA polymerase